MRGAWTLFKKEMLRFWDVWAQTLAAPVVSNVLFFVIFGSLFASRAGGGDAGDDYLRVLVPGLAVMGLMMNAFSNPLGSIMIAKYSNAIRELLSYPLKGSHIAVAFISAGGVRGVLVAIITAIVGAFFVPMSVVAPVWLIVFSVLIAIIFASLGIVTAVLSKTFDQSSMVQNFVLQPLIYLGGVFYSIESLPEFARNISTFNPIFYMVDGFRYGFLGTGDVSVWVSFAVTAVIALVSFLSASWIFKTGYKLKT